MLEECGSGSDSEAGELDCRSRLRNPGLGFDRAVLFWDSAVNDSLKLELIKRMLIEIAVLRVNACI